MTWRDLACFSLLLCDFRDEVRKMLNELQILYVFQTDSFVEAQTQADGDDCSTNVILWL